MDQDRRNQDDLINDNNSEEQGLHLETSYKIKKKKQANSLKLVDSVNSELIESHKSQSDKIKIQVPIENLNINQLFLDITQPNTLQYSQLRNILCIGQKEIEHNRQIIQQKWANLNRANISQFVYSQRKEAIQKSSIQDELLIKSKIIERLSDINTKGFASVNQISESYKKQYLSKHFDKKDDENLEFYLSKEDQDNYKESQFLLLDKLMREKTLVQPDASTFSEKTIDSNTYLIPKIRGEKIDAEQNYSVEDTYDSTGKNQSRVAGEKQKKINLCKYFCDPSELAPNHNAVARDYSSALSIDDLLLAKNGYQQFTEITPDHLQFIEFQDMVYMFYQHINDFILDEKNFEQLYLKYTSVLQYFQLKLKENVKYESLTPDEINKLMEMTIYLMNTRHFLQKFSNDKFENSQLRVQQSQLQSSLVEVLKQFK